MTLRHLGLGVLFLISVTGIADWEKIKPSEFYDSVGRPPTKGSTAEAADFQELHRLQDHRLPEDCRLAMTQLYPTIETMFGPKTGYLTAKEYKRIAKLLDRVMDYSLDVASHYKSKFSRPRPYVTDPTIAPCIPKPDGNRAFPSGHATSAAVSACLLAEIYPEKAERLLAYGEYLGDLRVRVGVHHPTDVESGKRLGKAICQRLLSDDDFLAELPSL